MINFAFYESYKPHFTGVPPILPDLDDIFQGKRKKEVGNAHARVVGTILPVMADARETNGATLLLYCGFQENKAFVK